MVSILCTILLLALMVEVNGEPQVPCYFVFGDSLVDNGNNNGLVSLAKANYLPYGIDFPGGPTGRFCNGPNSADILGQFLGFDQFIPPFTNTTGQDILKGVNYGSGGGGILEETGAQLGQRFSMNKQLVNHGLIVSRITLLLKSGKAARDYLNKCIYTVGMGSNDYINNYLQPEFYPLSQAFTPDEYAERLVKQYAQQLKELHGYGARKVAVYGVGLLGCTPAEIAANGGPDPSGCVDRINNYVQLFNIRLKPLVDLLNSRLPDAKFTYINVAQISSTLSGGLNSSGPCCDVNMFGLCVPNSIPCSNRNGYNFYDAFHPTTNSSSLVIERSYNEANPGDAHPYDISTLAGL